MHDAADNLLYHVTCPRVVVQLASDSDAGITGPSSTGQHIDLVSHLVLVSRSIEHSGHPAQGVPVSSDYELSQDATS
jgi:hypothetical protein